MLRLFLLRPKNYGLLDQILWDGAVCEENHNWNCNYCPMLQRRQQFEDILVVHSLKKIYIENTKVKSKHCISLSFII